MANKPATQDHKPKAEKAADNPVSVEVTRSVNGQDVDGYEITYKGVTVFAPKEAFDDFEFLDDVGQLDKRNDATALPSLLRRLIGEDFRRVMNELRDPKTGRVSVKAGSEYVLKVIGAVNPNG